jgi:two-component system nitrogen regulation sensor histidine kinase GlnL
MSPGNGKQDEGDGALAATVLGMLPVPVLLVDEADIVRYLNAEAEHFLDTGASVMVGRDLADVIPVDSPLFALIHQVRSQGRSIADFGMVLEGARIGQRIMSVAAGPLTGEGGGRIILTFFPESVARQIDNQLNHRNAARSVAAMAAMLAHEIKNPISGIRGAAQLLEQTVGDEDRALTQLICDESDRVVRLVDRMDAFAAPGPIERRAVNIHEVLERARRVAQNGFARNARFIERYDPSLPRVPGAFDQLVQVFLNLIKNAAEAVPAHGGEIVLTSSYQRGVSVVLPGQRDRINLPIVVTVQDNGNGIPDDLRDHLFDPFVTTKMDGRGLGLPLVAKVVGDHGGMIGFESRPRRTVFRVSLPAAEPGDPE